MKVVRQHWQNHQFCLAKKITLQRCDDTLTSERCWESAFKKEDNCQSIEWSAVT